ncbi:MAG: ATP-binding protein [Myxococcota bacterium]|nr:ATP-binding protein [Myxococcota bacterium]
MSSLQHTRSAPESDGATITITSRFLRSAAVARAVGWGVACPMLLALFSEAKASVHWYVVAVLVAYVYPVGMAWVSARVASPVRLVMAGHVFESVMLAIFAEVACTDPVFVLVALSVVVINAGVTRGRMGAGVVMLTFMVTSTLVFERLRAVGTIDPPIHFHVLLGLFLLGYVGVVSHQAYALVVRNASNKRELTRQRNRLDALHKHLVETISNPFVSDEDVLKIIGPGLSESQARAYAERIRTRQRWEAIGRQTRSLAHDANNLLVPILMTGELLEERLGDDEEARGRLSDLETAVRQLEALHRQMNPRDRSPAAASDPADLRHVVEEVVALVRATVPTRIAVDVRDSIGDGPVPVVLEASALHRCLLNLCINAVQAMDEDGRLTLTLRPATAAEQLRLRRPGHLGVAVRITDTGPGVPAEVARQVFDPYFTTRGDDGGTGLGLSTTHALVTDAGGTITLESAPGAGATFMVVLPSARSV